MNGKGKSRLEELATAMHWGKEEVDQFINELKERINFCEGCNGSHEKTDLDERITRVLDMFGMPWHIQGSKYVREAIKQVMIHPDMLDAVTTKLYPTVGEVFNTTASRVQKGIWYAIKVTWECGNMNKISKFFGSNYNSFKKRPSNSKFIAHVAKHLQKGGD